MRPARAAAILLILPGVIPPAAAQPPQLAQYETIVLSYRTNDGERAVASILTWSDSNLRFVLEILPAHLEMTLPTELESRRFLRAAGMLHSDAAIEADRRSDTAAFDRHVSAAEHLFDASDRLKGHAILARWQLAMGLYLTQEARLDEAASILTRACKTFPLDGRLQLACGMVTATHATLVRYIIPTEDELRRGGDPARRELAVRRSAVAEQQQLMARRDALLAAAARYFSAAIRADASLLEARVRLAHVHTLSGHDTLAQPLLSALAATDLPRELSYLAKLIQGGIRQREGNTKEAADWYRRARAVVPGAQAAFVALAHVLSVAGDRTASRATIDELLTRRRSEDPWAQLLVEFLATPAPSLTGLRDEVRR